MRPTPRRSACPSHVLAASVIGSLPNVGPHPKDTRSPVLAARVGHERDPGSRQPAVGQRRGARGLASSSGQRSAGADARASSRRKRGSRQDRRCRASGRGDSAATGPPLAVRLVLIPLLHALASVGDFLRSGHAPVEQPDRGPGRARHCFPARLFALDDLHFAGLGGRECSAGPGRMAVAAARVRHSRGARLSVFRRPDVLRRPNRLRGR